MEPNDIIGTIFSLNNPAIFAIIFMVILTAVVVMIKKEFIIPLKKRIKELEEENEQLRKS